MRPLGEDVPFRTLEASCDISLFIYLFTCTVKTINKIEKSLYIIILS